MALALPETEEVVRGGGLPAWSVRGKTFVWERSLRRADRYELGAAAPDGSVLGVRMADVGVKAALLADEPAAFFTTTHFDGFPAVLADLDTIGLALLEEVIVDAWLTQAPKRLRAAFLEQRG